MNEQDIIKHVPLNNLNPPQDFNEEEDVIEKLIKEQKKLANKKFEKTVEYILHKPNGNIQVVKYTRKKYISPEMIEDMKNMLNNKIKRKDICAKYNITMPTLKKYVG